MSFGEYFALFGAAVAGGLAAFVVPAERQAIVQWIVAFSGAFLLGLAITHLIPGLLATPEIKHIGIWILGGFTIQLLLEPLSKGIEHGHFHPIKTASVWPIMIGLLVHALLEGMPLNGYVEIGHMHQHDHAHEGNKLLWGILVHKAPAAFTLISLLRLSGMRTGKVLMLLLLFACASPAGALAASVLPFGREQLLILLAIVTGSFLHLSTTILFENSSAGRSHQVSWPKLTAIVLGFAVAITSTL